MTNTQTYIQIGKKLYTPYELIKKLDKEDPEIIKAIKEMNKKQ